jgi:hypothetical protein
LTPYLPAGHRQLRRPGQRLHLPRLLDKIVQRSLVAEADLGE